MDIEMEDIKQKSLIENIKDDIFNIIENKPIEEYIMWGVIITTVLLLLLHIYSKLLSYDGSNTYVQYYL